MIAQQRLMLEMLPNHHAQWNLRQRLEGQRMVAEREGMAAKRDTSAAKRAKWAHQSIASPQPNGYMMVDPV